ncbi:hypothetical protein MIZ03_4046 [Rhodoferax lithotrophicus]|uniref:Uncharacterized protein n=1 Tax=Rhodoferax lithotrophicus TaxID=2798804 RepID=A0ABN6DDT0_9BURK|nr:hypothetical protein MIZ03_4046 [Rhodoferax sp. MIZ03]
MDWQAICILHFKKIRSLQKNYKMQFSGQGYHLVGGAVMAADRLASL